MPTRTSTEGILFIPGQSNSLSKGLIVGMQKIRQGQRSGNSDLAKYDRQVTSTTFKNSKAGKGK